MENTNYFKKIKRLRQITLTGDLCSGKSTTCKLLVDKLNLEYVSVGNMFREEAKRQGISILELNKQYEGTDADLNYDKMIFDLRSTDNIIVDARMGWFFLPESFKVYLKTDPKEIVRRARKSDRGNVEKYCSDEEAYKALVGRKQSELDRFNELYYIDFNNPNNFDLIIDTTNLSVEEVADQIIEQFNKFLKEDVLMFNFNNLYPSQNIRVLNDDYVKTIPTPIEPIKVFKKDNYYWIVDGHNRAARCKQLGIDVPCILVNIDPRDYFITNIYDWEDTFHFRYVFPPIKTIS